MSESFGLRRVFCSTIIIAWTLGRPYHIFAMALRMTMGQRRPILVRPENASQEPQKEKLRVLSNSDVLAASGSSFFGARELHVKLSQLSTRRGEG